MAVFEDARQHTDNEVVVKLLTSLAERPETTQRDLATEMGISLGMMVGYIKSCVRKGFIRSTQVAPKRWAYFVTPKGFAEKGRMVSGYLWRSMTFFRDTRLQLEELFKSCQDQNIKSIALVGDSDVAEIARLVSTGLEINLTAISSFDSELLKSFDAVLVTDTQDPQGTFDKLKAHISEDRLLSIASMCIARRRVKDTRRS